MSLINGPFLPFSAHSSIIIVFVFIFGTLSLVFGNIKKSGNSGSGGKKPDPADDPINFFDSTTASLVNATSSPDEPEKGRLPNNFFDSTTAAVMGKESAEQVKLLNEIENPNNFFDYFAASVMDLQASPSVPATIIYQNQNSPLPPQPQVPFMTPKESEDPSNGQIQEEKAETINVNSSDRAEHANEGITHDEKEERDVPNLELAQSKTTHNQIANAAFELKQNEVNEIKIQSEELQNKKFDEIEILKNHKSGHEDEKQNPAPPAPAAPPPGGGGKQEEPIFAPNKDYNDAIKSLKTLIEEFSKFKILDGKTKKLLNDTIKLLDDAGKKSHKLSEEIREVLKKIISPYDLEMLEKVLSQNEEGDGGNKGNKGKAESKAHAFNKLRQIDEFNKAIVLVRDKCTTTPGLKPSELIKSHFGWDYAHAC